MPLPTKDEILGRARRIELEDIVGKGLPALTPEDYELKESGAFHKARRQLMSGHTGEMERYVKDIADEMGLVVYAKSYVKKLQQAEKRREEWERKKTKGQNGNAIVFLAHAMKPKIPFLKPTPKVVSPKIKLPKRKVQHIQRTSKTMRSLRKVKGVKVFSFPDHIWKVRR